MALLLVAERRGGGREGGGRRGVIQSAYALWNAIVPPLLVVMATAQQSCQELDQLYHSILPAGGRGGGGVGRESWTDGI